MVRNDLVTNHIFTIGFAEQMLRVNEPSSDLDERKLSSYLIQG